MTIPARNPSADLTGGNPVFSSHSSLALNCLDSNRLAVAAWLALFLLAARLDAADDRLVGAGSKPALVAHAAHHFTNTGVRT